MSTEMKLCRDCGKSLSIDNFCNDRSYKDNLRPRCKKCDKIRKQRYKDGVAYKEDTAVKSIHTTSKRKSLFEVPRRPVGVGIDGAAIMNAPSWLVDAGIPFTAAIDGPDKRHFHNSEVAIYQRHSRRIA